MASAKSKVHAHVCSNPGCRTRYEDACEETATNHPCRLCRIGKEWELLVMNRAPKDCCRLHSRLARKEELVSYRLAGDVAWYICRVCARTQGYDPTARDLFHARRSNTKEMSHA